MRSPRSYVLKLLTLGLVISCSHGPRLQNSEVVEREPSGTKETCKLLISKFLRKKKTSFAVGGTFALGATGYVIAKASTESDEVESDSDGIGPSLKIVMLSDSLSKNHYHAAIPSALWRMHT